MPYKEKYLQQTNTFSTKIVHGHVHVLMPFYRNSTEYRDPNYMNTGKALIGVLNKEKGQTLSEFKEKWVENKMILESISATQKAGKKVLTNLFQIMGQYEKQRQLAYKAEMRDYVKL